jgi:sialate O-acetylesterase
MAPHSVKSATLAALRQHPAAHLRPRNAFTTGRTAVIFWPFSHQPKESVMKNLLALPILAAAIAFSGGCHQSQSADIRLPSVIGDNMVIQHGGKVNLWGWAEPGKSLTIKGDWQKDAMKAVAGKDGKWMAAIDAPKAGGPYTITFTGKNTVTLRNILCGEVWVCSGQSNMAFTLGDNGLYWCKGIPGWEQAVAEANSLPQIRLFDVPYNPKDTPQTNVDAKWTVATGPNARKFSAVGYLYAKRLNKELGVPVGMIGSYYGASNAETWTRNEILMADKEFKADAESYYTKTLPPYEKAAKAYPAKLADYKAAAAKAKAEGKPAPKAPKEPQAPRNKEPSALYNGMIAPVIPFNIRGAIWYQGESNPDPNLYRRLFPAMIANWRGDWGEGDFPFYFVQLAPYDKVNPAICEVQTETMLKVPNTGMAVITDVGEKTNIHPRDKFTVANRLAQWALAKTYGMDVPFCGPLYKGMKKEDGRIRISFDYTANGLVAMGGDLREFTIAGKDGEFVPAKAYVDEHTVVAYSPDVNEPQNVRFGWGKWIRPNLYNTDGLPAVPFRSDAPVR